MCVCVFFFYKTIVELHYLLIHACKISSYQRLKTTSHKDNSFMLFFFIKNYTKDEFYN